MREVCKVDKVQVQMCAFATKVDPVDKVCFDAPAFAMRHSRFTLSWIHGISHHRVYQVLIYSAL